jgi:hypothetical protein
LLVQSLSLGPFEEIAADLPATLSFTSADIEFGRDETLVLRNE